jgi:flagellar hook assembly protein FlgD
VGNYPNPFNASTSIKYTLPENAHVEIAIYNIQGQLVRTLSKGEESSGTHLAIWDGKDNIGKQLPSGIYFYKLSIGGEFKIKKMVLMR